MYTDGWLEDSTILGDNVLTHPEIEMERLLTKKKDLDELLEKIICEHAQVQETIRLLKSKIKQEQEALKQALEVGGISLEEEYPERLDPERLTYFISNGDLQNSGISTDTV